MTAQVIPYPSAGPRCEAWFDAHWAATLAESADGAVRRMPGAPGPAVLVLWYTPAVAFRPHGVEVSTAAWEPVAEGVNLRRRDPAGVGAPTRTASTRWDVHGAGLVQPSELAAVELQLVGDRQPVRVVVVGHAEGVDGFDMLPVRCACGGRIPAQVTPAWGVCRVCFLEGRGLRR